MQCDSNLLQVVNAMGATRRFSHALHRGQQQRDQHADDGDHDQKLHQSEPIRGGFSSGCTAELNSAFHDWGPLQLVCSRPQLTGSIRLVQYLFLNSKNLVCEPCKPGQLLGLSACGPQNYRSWPAVIVDRISSPGGPETAEGKSNSTASAGSPTR